jgi:hypothetical protein
MVQKFNTYFLMAPNGDIVIIVKLYVVNYPFGTI